MYRWVQQVLVLAVAVVDVVDDGNDAEPVLAVVMPGSMKQENTIQDSVPLDEKTTCHCTVPNEKEQSQQQPRRQDHDHNKSLKVTARHLVWAHDPKTNLMHAQQNEENVFGHDTSTVAVDAALPLGDGCTGPQ